MYRTSAETVVADMWHALADFACLEYVNSTVPVPNPYTFEQHIDAARSIRDFLDRDCKHKGVCAVCSMYRRQCDLEVYDLEEVPNLHLLDASMPKTAKQPRDALTTFVWQNVTYCMQPDACHADERGERCSVDVCVGCFSALKNKRVPDESLVCFDTGEARWAQRDCGA